MGTNYEVATKACPTCGHYEILHIGKSSGGWCFALHVFPGQSHLPQNLEDWKRLWEQEGNVITNEYGEQLTPRQMEGIVLREKWVGAETFRRRDDCVAHGDGLYDLIEGEFS